MWRAPSAKQTGTLCSIIINSSYFTPQHQAWKEPSRERWLEYYTASPQHFVLSLSSTEWELHSTGQHYAQAACDKCHYRLPSPPKWPLICSALNRENISSIFQILLGILGNNITKLQYTHAYSQDVNMKTGLCTNTQIHIDRHIHMCTLTHTLSPGHLLKSNDHAGVRKMKSYVNVQLCNSVQL